MDKHGYRVASTDSAAAVPAEPPAEVLDSGLYYEPPAEVLDSCLYYEPPAEVLTSKWLLEKQEANAEKIRQENLEIESEEAEEKKKDILRPRSPRGPGPHTCTSCGSRPWQPLFQDLCDRCNLRVAYEKSWKGSGCKNRRAKKEEAYEDSDHSDDDDAPKPKGSARAKKACGKQRGLMRQCPKCKKKTWEMMPLAMCDSCGLREALDKRWAECLKPRAPKKLERLLDSSDPRQTAASSSWQAPQLQVPWRDEPPPELPASSSSQAPTGMRRSTSRHNKIPGTDSWQ